MQFMGVGLVRSLQPPDILLIYCNDAERDWGQEKKGMTEDEMAGWHH